MIFFTKPGRVQKGHWCAKFIWRFYKTLFFTFIKIIYCQINFAAPWLARSKTYLKYANIFEFVLSDFIYWLPCLR